MWVYATIYIMKKILIPICTISILFVGYVLYTHESCACFKPSDIIKFSVLQTRDEIKSIYNDFSHVCTSTSTRALIDDLYVRYKVQLICTSTKDDFALRVKLPNHSTFCTDTDDIKEGYTFKKDAVTCD